ncbi:MAG: hypothetical protein IKW64_07830 [Clostridia bacterium]|nr:hypothetical protein [Clostridia bacterium]
MNIYKNIYLAAKTAIELNITSDEEIVQLLENSDPDYIPNVRAIMAALSNKSLSDKERKYQIIDIIKTAKLLTKVKRFESIFTATIEEIMSIPDPTNERLKLFESLDDETCAIAKEISSVLLNLCLSDEERTDRLSKIMDDYGLPK